MNTTVSNRTAAYQPCKGEIVSRFQLAYTRNDYWIVEIDDLFYVAKPAYEQKHGGRVPRALIESWACPSLTSAVDRLDDMLDSIAEECKRFGNE